MFQKVNKIKVGQKCSKKYIFVQLYFDNIYVCFLDYLRFTQHLQWISIVQM